MKFQLSCIIDADMIQPVTELLAPYSRIVLKMVDADKPPKPTTVGKVSGLPVRASPVAFRRLRGKKRGGEGPILALRAVGASPDGRGCNEALRQAFANASPPLSPDGAGATLSKLRARGYLRRPDKGIWRLTAKGEAALARLDKPLVAASPELIPDES